MTLRRAPRRRAGAPAVLATLIATVLLSGCVTQPVLPYQASVANQMKLGSLPRAARFQVTTAGSDPSDVQTTVRSMRISAPGDGSWTSYLGQALRTELATSGNYDANAAARIEATLSEVRIADGQAQVTGHFVIRQGQSVRYDKVLRADAHWDSAFLGAIAASNGLNQSTAIFQALLRKLFDDPDFAAAST
ncbi:hypothetical protein SAMN04487926_103383 [Paraburkholderia steynii]|uniref:ABC-type transport auxiliary lipoprotein component domain-containing protein n=1 Tax=Paraburkholderia steynii TaxID=1245441 RepID=A0A7Z7FFE6_9BURK|nr:hypothetical protein [Paraburkholderia steynii]SDH29791.1 hypothetical protein SAMN04487926_103383 [Paraburkholderia steynii]